MKAQFIYERLNFERGQDPKYSIGIGKIALIKKWFDEWAPDKIYKIDKDLNIEVEGYLDLTNTNITSLPDNLKVGRSLYLKNTKITSLPDNLKVKGKIYKDF